MQKIAITLVLSSLFFVSPVMAGGEHGHGHSHAQAPVTQVTAEKNADKVIASLVERKKIDRSWLTIKASSIKKEAFNGRSEWVVLFNNEKITNVDKQKLFIFLAIAGEYIAVNHTGK